MEELVAELGAAFLSAELAFPSGELHLAWHGKLDPGFLRNSSGRAQSWQGGTNAIAAKSGFGGAPFGNGGAVG
jgi:hypothetical protein